MTVLLTQYFGFFRTLNNQNLYFTDYNKLKPSYFVSWRSAGFRLVFARVRDAALTGNLFFTF